MFRQICITIAALLVSALTANGAVLLDRRCTDQLLCVHIRGQITESEAKAFEEVESELRFKDLWVYLNSEGGDPQAAMKIGRIIRKYEGTTLITDVNFPGDPEHPWSEGPWWPDRVKCYSACTLIFIAGVARYSSSDGELGLHRPYFSSVPLPRDVIEKTFPIVLATIKSYVSEMGVTDNVYQQMINTEPAEMVVYRGDAVKQIISEKDPLHEEIEIAREARLYGITTAEMRGRLKQANESCKHFDFGCSFAIYWGLSITVLSGRSAVAERVCKMSAEDEALLQKLPGRLRSENSINLRHEDCVRDIMLGRRQAMRAAASLRHGGDGTFGDSS